MAVITDVLHDVHPVAALEREAFFAWLNGAFGKPGSRFFQEHYGHVLGEGAPVEETCFVIREEGRYLAHVGLYPLDLKTSVGVLPIAGIGQVAVDPGARGRGLAVAIMEKAHDIALAQGKAACFLGGNRSLYARFGYEICGLQYEWAWDRRRFPQRCLLARTEDAGLLHRFWKERPQRVLWPREVFPRLLSKPGWEHWVDASSGSFLASVKKEEGRVMVDVCAGNWTLFPSVMNALGDHYALPVYLRHHAGHPSLHALMASSGMDILRRMQGMVKILDAGAIRRALREGSGGDGAVLARLEGREFRKDEESLRLQREAARAVFGDPFDGGLPASPLVWDLERISYI